MAMNGLPLDTDLSFLHNKELLQVRIGWAQAQLMFEDAVYIAIECEIHIVYPNAFWEAHNHFPLAANSLSKLIAQKIKKIDIVPPETLKLSFENGIVLEIIEEKVPYESYQIHNGDKIIAV